jgi:ankyrin repeat protein
MAMDTSEDANSEVARLLEELNKLEISWKDEKAIITTLITEHGMHPNVIKYVKSIESFPLYRAVLKSDVPFAEFLIEKRADVSAQVTIGRNSPLLFSAQTKEMAALLLNKGASVNAKGDSSTEPLLFEIARMPNRNPDMITFYGQQGVNVFEVNQYKESPLHALVIAGRAICLPRKLRIKCPINAENIVQKIQKVQKFIEIGVPFDTKSDHRIEGWGDMTVIQQLRVIIKNGSYDEDKESDSQLLAVLTQSVQKKAFEDIHFVLPKDLAGIVVTYYGDGQTDKEIDEFAARIKKKEEEYAASSRKSSLNRQKNWSFLLFE